MTDQTKIATTIIKQLAGGTNRLAAMTGANTFLTGHKDNGAVGGVSFKFKRPSRGKPNFCRILLMESDTYKVEFMSLHGYNAKMLKSVDGLYADQLTDLFENTTGLYLSL